MSNTIFLTPKTTRWIILLNGIFNLLLGVRHLAAHTTPVWNLIFGIAWTLAGMLMTVYGIVLFHGAHKLIPKVHVDELGISIREDVHSEEKHIAWKEVKEINFKAFEIDFYLKGKVIKTVVLHTNAEISIAIKRTIRTFSEERNIPVKGG